MDSFYLERIKEIVLGGLRSIAPKAIYSILALLIGIFLIKLIMNLLKKTFKKYKVELSLQSFLESLSIFILYGFLFAIIGSIIGVEATSFLAIFGAAGIAIGLALQGSLANFAGGILILAFKPFKVGDLINVNSNTGIVEKIDILYTRLKTFDGRIITMPNGYVANTDVDNRSKEPIRRINLEFKFAFEIKMEVVRPIILNTLKSHPLVEKNPEPDAWLDSLGESDFKVIARCWVKTEDYWPTYWEQLEAVKRALDEHGIETPIPRRIIYDGGKF
jgi:small conductance mechanosensitive channel